MKYEYLFEINKYIGWIILVFELDREKQEVYNLIVQVEQKFGMFIQVVSNSIVIVTVTDCNDNFLVFSQFQYQIAVNEDVLLGIVFLVFKIIDVDVKSNVDYFIVDGDFMGRFKIYKNGDIYVIKSLDREMVFNYVLIVVVLDGFFVFIVKVNVEILDVNDNVLVCDQVNKE